MHKITKEVLLPFKYKDKLLKFKKFKKKNITKKYLSWLNNKKLMIYSRHKKINHNKFTATKYLNSMKDNWFLMICIKEKKNYIHIGNISVYFQKNNFASISILVGPDKFLSRGIGNIVWKKIIKILNKITLVKIVYAGTHHENIKMIKIFKSNKMLITKKKNYVYGVRNLRR